MLFRRFYNLLIITSLILCLKPLTCLALDEEESQSLSTLNEDADQNKVGGSQSPSWWPPATPNDARANAARRKTAAELQAKMREMNEMQQKEAAQLQQQRLAQLRQMEDAERQRLVQAAQRERDQRMAQERAQSLRARQLVEAQREAAARRQAEILAAEQRAAHERELAAQRYAASQQADLARQAAMEAEANRQQEENREAEDGMVHWRVKYGSGWHRADTPPPPDTTPDQSLPAPTHPMQPGYGISDNWVAPQNEGGSVNGKPEWSSPHDIKLSRPITPQTDGTHDVGDSSLPPISQEPQHKSTAPLLGTGASEGASRQGQETKLPMGGTGTHPPSGESFPVDFENPKGAQKGEALPGGCPGGPGCRHKAWHPNYKWRKKGLMPYKVENPSVPPTSFSPSQSTPSAPAVKAPPQPNGLPSLEQTPSPHVAPKTEEVAPLAGGLAAAGAAEQPAQQAIEGAPSRRHQRKAARHKKSQEEKAPVVPETPPQPTDSPTPPEVAAPAGSASKNTGYGEVSSAPRVEGESAGTTGSSSTSPAGVSMSPEQQRILHDLVQQEHDILHGGHSSPPPPAAPAPQTATPQQRVTPVNRVHRAKKKLAPETSPPPVEEPAPLPAPVEQHPPAPHKIPRPRPAKMHGFGHHADDRIMPKARRIGSVAVPPSQPTYEPGAVAAPKPVAPAKPQPLAVQSIPTRQVAPAVPAEAPAPPPVPSRISEQTVNTPPAPTFQEPEPAPPSRHIARPAPAMQQPTYQAPVSTGVAEAPRETTRQSVPQPPPVQPSFTPASPSHVTSEEQAPPPGYRATAQPPLGGSPGVENASRTAVMGAYHPPAVRGGGTAATGTGTAGGMRHGIFAAGRVMGARGHPANVLDLPGHWEGAVAALTGDAWSVIQTHRDPFFYGEPEDRTPAGQPLCHMVRVDGESTLDFSTSPAHELGGHVWDVDLHNAGLTSRPGVVVPVTMRSASSHGAPLTLSGVQYSGTLRVGDLNNEAAARIAKLFTQSPHVVIGTDQGQYDVDTSGFGKGNARHAFTYCLAQDLSADPAFYDAAPSGMKFVHEGAQ